MDQIDIYRPRYNPHTCAMLIRGALAIRGVKQTQLARRTGIDRYRINMYLNRRIDLTQPDIEKILDELEIKDQTKEDRIEHSIQQLARNE